MTTKRVSVGAYTVELPLNGIMTLYCADDAGEDHRMAWGMTYLDALVDFAREVIRLRAILDVPPLPTEEVQPMMAIPPEGWKP